MSTPRVSVIVPTRHRAESLRELVDSLELQTFVDFEVIVVDDAPGSSCVEHVTSRDPSRIRLLRSGGVGAVEARCLGIKAARGEIFAFTDDDCVADPEWLQTGVRAIDEGADVVQGGTVPQRHVLPFERTVAHRADDGLFPTCNVFYRRTAYDRAGGFDRFAADRLGFRHDRRARGLGFGEDTLLGWSVARSGRRVAAPEAVVRHEVRRTSIREMFSRAWMAGAFPRLVREIPELRETLVSKRFVLGRSDERLGVYGLVFLLSRRFRPIGAVLALYWIASRARRLVSAPGPLRGRASALPLQLALDVTTTVALVVGSIRSRTTVL